MMDFRFHLVHAVLPQCQWNVSTTMGIYLWRAVHAFTRKDTLCVLSMFFFVFFPFFPPFFSPCKLRANGNYSYNNDSSGQFSFVHSGIYKPWKAYAFHSVRKKCEQRWFWNWVMIALSRLCSQHQKDVRSLSTVCFQLTSSSNIFHVLKRHKILRDTSIPVQ